VEILKAAATGKPVRYKGEVFQVGWYNPSWVKSPPPAIYAGANGPQMLRVQPRHADGVMVSDFVPGHVARARAIIDASLREAGRDPAAFPMNNFWAWHVKPTREEAAIVNRNINAFIRAYNRKSDVIEGVPPEIVQKLVDRCTSAVALADIDREIERLREFERAGLAEIALRIYEDPADTIRILGERVVPALA
jgi:alkanesulfonate monooxygenase SsuD/methylene tetrahydromethanopterin reductase-like flavin-dependent oxidoreductase (luciferase family)